MILARDAADSLCRKPSPALRIDYERRKVRFHVSFRPISLCNVPQEIRCWYSTGSAVAGLLMADAVAAADGR